MFNDSLTIVSAGYERLGPGKWIKSDTTIDEPQYFILKANPKPSGPSDFLIRCERTKNSPTGGADSVASVHLVLKGDFKMFTQVELEALRDQVVTFCDSGNLTKLFRGEL